jgi:hypothetical protein
MSWKEPKTWVDQETPTATDFNTEIRDNLNALSTHSHTGAAGDGSSTLDSVDHIDLDEGGALSTPASGHTRFAANNDGTLRIFPDGGSEKTLSDTTHTHPFTEDVDVNQGSQTTGATSYYDANNATPADGDDIETSTDTIAANSKVFIAAGLGAKQNSLSDRNRVVLIYDGAIVGTSGYWDVGVGNIDQKRLVYETNELTGGSITTTLEWDVPGATGGMIWGDSWLVIHSWDLAGA